ncbi:MAG: hypothetical protein ACI8PZ_005878 [Myxococcota bacterium]|jgi:hypothetical protein
MRPIALLPLIALLGCATHLDPAESETLPPPAPTSDGPAPTAEPSPAPPPSERADRREAFVAFQDELSTAWETHPHRRVVLQADKPLYRHGDTLWVSAFDLRDRDLSTADARPDLTLRLQDPRGATVHEMRVTAADERVHSAIDWQPGWPGGRYVLQALVYGEVLAERPIFLDTFEAPRLKKTLDFLRKAYGAGDTVKANVTAERATGEPLADRELTARITVDGRELDPVRFTTNAAGEGLVAFTLPDSIEVGDGLLTVLVEDGGLVESVSKAVPIIVDRVDLDLFPEGGDLVRGLASRVYFEARTPLGKPADVAGRVVDDRGQEVATFRSLHDGRGRFPLTPERGRGYRVEITEPAGVATTFELPKPVAEGCVLRTFDDPEGVLPAIRVGIRCTEARTVDVQAVLRGNLLDGTSVEVPSGKEAVVYLEPDDPALQRAQGAAVVTVFDGREPLAERMVYRNRRARLGVSVEVDKERYTPRDGVTVTVTTTDADGEPVPAALALAVVDDTLLSYADDEEGHLLTRLFLEADLPDPDVELFEPNWYFDLDEPDAAAALDHVLGTRGWRRFDWQTAMAPPNDLIGQLEGLGYVGFGRGGGGMDFAEAEVAGMLGVVNGAAPMAGGAPPPAPPVDAARAAKPQVKEQRADMPDEAQPVEEKIALRERGNRDRAQGLEIAGKAKRAEAFWDADGIIDQNRAANQVAIAPVRVFAAPPPQPGYSGPRHDFRDTIFWAGDLRTDDNGVATVTFPTSDAITSFRVTTQGVGGGLAGRDETVFASSLPFSSTVKLPVAVSEGDRIDLPIALSNETDRALAVNLDTSFGDLLRASESGTTALDLAAGARDARRVSVEVVGKMGSAAVHVSASAAGLSDVLDRTLTVSPLGFPVHWEQSGEAEGAQSWPVDLGQAVPGTVQATVTLYPSPVATLVEGMEGMLREPSGCFEQTSSSNYPNVMVLRYLEENDAAAPDVVRKAQGLLDRGYAKLAGYETPDEGYEWFGSSPPHEALTAYGLVEFMDMRGVHDGVDSGMIDRTAAWLLSRRDGKGGFKRDGKALDSFGRASPEITDAYITWSLARAGFADQIPKELARAVSAAESTKDAYLLALSAGTLGHAGHPAFDAAVTRLVAMQEADGAFRSADHSITRSGGINLHIETTALAALAMMQDGRSAEVRSAISWMNDNRSGFGNWGATQATVLALDAMTTYAKLSRKTRGPGTIVVRLNGDTVETLSYVAGHRDALVIDGFGEQFLAGANTLEVLHDGEALPFSAAVSFRSVKPATAEDSAVEVRTALAKSTVGMGETVRLTTTIANRTDEGQPMVVARIGLPGGVSPQRWQLEDLRKAGTVDFYETNPREVVLYFRQLEPSQSIDVPLDLTADVPGHYTAPASSAWLYYTDDLRWWADPVVLDIEG